MKGNFPVYKYYKKIRRKIYEFFGNAKYTPKLGLNNLDDKLEKYLNFKSGFFVELGANDGYKQSNTYYLERGKKWKGILIEPVPELFEKCKKIRGKSLVLNLAIVNSDYNENTITIHYAGLMSTIEDSRPKKDLKTHIKRGIEVQNLTHTYSISVPVSTLSNVFTKYQVKKIDFLSLDVEGAELDVLKGMNISKFRPKYILVETNKYYEDVNKFLSENGYKLMEKMTQHDYFFSDSLV